MTGMDAFTTATTDQRSAKDTTPIDETITSAATALPDSLLLEIFSHLSPPDLGRASCVSWQWNRVACDELLWRSLIQRDCGKWSSLSHQANPALFEFKTAAVTNRERYLRCSPEFRHSLKSEAPSLSLTQLLPDFLRRAWPFYRREMPKFAFFGPGLDRGCGGLPRKFVNDGDKQFHVGKGFPGIRGMGSGFACTLKHKPDSQGKSESVLGVTFLYSATRMERGNREAPPNRLFQHTTDPDTGDSTVDISATFKILTSSLGGLIYVLSAAEEMSSQEQRSARNELSAIANFCAQATNGRPMPLLVLTLLRREDEEPQRKMTCPDAIQLLNLNELPIPWRVYNARIEQGVGLVEGIQWLLDMFHERCTA